MKQTADEVILAIIEGDQPHRRIVIARKMDSPDRSTVLRQESFSDGVGWFTQTSILLSARELGMLRSCVNLPGCFPSTINQTTKKSAPQQVPEGSAEPGILPFPSVSAAG